MGKRILLLCSFIVLGFVFASNNSYQSGAITAQNNGILFNPDLTYGTINDIDGNVYKTITIGTQTWMAENLRTTKFRNGKDIPEVTVDSIWAILTTGAYCNYKNTRNIDTIVTYGRLYNWYAVYDSRNIAPEGWHISNEADWTTLTNYLGGPYVAGLKLKEPVQPIGLALIPAQPTKAVLLPFLVAAIFSTISGSAVAGGWLRKIPW